MIEATKPQELESEPEVEKHAKPVAPHDARAKSVAIWTAISGTWVFVLYFFVYMVYHSIMRTPTEGWYLSLLEKHYVAVVGTPMSAVASFCIVTLLKVSHGPIEFEALGFKFRGASGPIVFWLLCFLAMIAALYLLWEKTV